MSGGEGCLEVQLGRGMSLQQVTGAPLGRTLLRIRQLSHIYWGEELTIGTQAPVPIWNRSLFVPHRW